MKRPIALSAVAHLLLVSLLYLEAMERKRAEDTREELTARQRHEALRREASRWRALERLQNEAEGASDAGAPAGPGDAGRGPHGGPRGAGAAGSTARAGHGKRGARVRLGHRGGRFTGWEQGPMVPQSSEERRVLAEPQLEYSTPGRVFLGQPTGASWSFVDSWYTIGPFPEGREGYPPEAQVDLDARYVGASGASVRWLHHQSSQPEIVPSTMTPYSVHYAYTKLRSDREREAWLAFGGDDAMKVWLNGELVWDCGEHWRAWALDEGARQVTLRQGYNALLVRLDNWPDHGAFSVAVRH